MNEWLTLSLAFLLVWLVVWIIKKNLRKKMLWSSIYKHIKWYRLTRKRSIKT